MAQRKASQNSSQNEPFWVGFSHAIHTCKCPPNKLSSSNNSVLQLSNALLPCPRSQFPELWLSAPAFMHHHTHTIKKTSTNSPCPKAFAKYTQCLFVWAAFQYLLSFGFAHLGFQVLDYLCYLFVPHMTSACLPAGFVFLECFNCSIKWYIIYKAGFFSPSVQPYPPAY